MESVIRLMPLWQTIPIALLMFAPVTKLKLRVGQRHSIFISALYFFLGCAALIIFCASASKHGNIILWNIWLVVLLVVYFSGWACAVPASGSHKLLTLAVMLHCAAMLNAANVSFLSLFLDKDRLTSIHTSGEFPLMLCVYLTVLVLIWYFLRHVFWKRLLFLNSQKARRGIFYLCTILVLFCLTAYDPAYKFLTRPPLFVTTLAATDLIACIIFFRENSLATSQTETSCDLAVRQLQHRQLSQAMEEVRQLRHEMRCHVKQYDAACNWLEKQNLSGNPVVDTALEYFLFQALLEEIPVKCKISVESKDSMDKIDLIVLLNACLENAMDTLRTLPPKARQLSISIFVKSGILLVQLTNSDNQNSIGGFCTGNTICEGPKSAAPRHMTAIAEKYDGFVQFQQKDGKFSILAFLYTGQVI